MLYSKERNFVFISVSKAGSTSIAKAFRGEEDVVRNKLDTNADVETIPEHAGVRELILEFGEEKWNELFSFAVVRNPWARVVSAYHFYKDGRAAKDGLKRTGKWGRRIANVIMAKVVPFPLWIRLHPLRSCSDFLCDEAGNFRVNEVIKLEEINDKFPDICEKLGFGRREVPQENKSVHPNYMKYYGKSSREYIARRYRKDIESFGYAFGD